MPRVCAAILTGFVLTCFATVASALPVDFSFQGTLSSDDDVVLISFTANGASTVTLRSYSYAGGIQANGNAVASGGFDPILALFDGAGNLIAQNDDGSGVPSDPTTGAAFDTLLTSVLPAGSYLVAVSQFSNFALGPTLADGFQQAGSPTFTSVYGCPNGQFCDYTGANRTNAWAFDVLGVETAQVPEPGLLLLLAGLVGSAVLRRVPCR